MYRGIFLANFNDGVDCSIKSVVDCPFVMEVIHVYPIKTGLSSGFCLLLSSNPFLLMQKLKVWDW